MFWYDIITRNYYLMCMVITYQYKYMIFFYNNILPTLILYLLFLDFSSLADFTLTQFYLFFSWRRLHKKMYLRVAAEYTCVIW